MVARCINNPDAMAQERRLDAVPGVVAGWVAWVGYFARTGTSGSPP